MRFSVLLPTRNRLDLLRYAVESVRRQDHADWEIIVSDNHSEDDIAGYVRTLNDPRIRYYRTASFIPVTDNWNNALEHSSGEYVIMLGDDDALMKGTLRTLDRLIRDFNAPDVIYTKALLYAYPGVMPDFPNGFLKPYDLAPFFRGAEVPFWLSRDQAAGLAGQSLNFRMAFTFNMQHSIVNRGLIDRLGSKGRFFQSPYPDFYANNVLFLKAERILISPEPLVIVGISPKSFGYYFFNKKEDAGVEFLNNLKDPDSVRALQHVILPGSKDRTCWLIAMETIRANFGSELDIRVNYNRYRYLQTLSYYALPEPERAHYRSMLRWWEVAAYLFPLWLAAVVGRLLPREFRNNLFNKVFFGVNNVPRKAESDMPVYRNILEVFEGAGADRKA